LRFTKSWNIVKAGSSLGEIVMKLRIAAFLLSLAFMSGTAFAHGDQKHVSGTIEKITADSVFVKTADGKSVEVKLVAATNYVLHVANKSDTTPDRPAKLSDLVVGDHVLIHATPKGDTLEATEVRFSTTGAAAAPSSKPKG
jgi:hypothetical protein